MLGAGGLENLGVVLLLQELLLVALDVVEHRGAVRIGHDHFLARVYDVLEVLTSAAGHLRELSLTSASSAKLRTGNIASRH